MITSRVTSDGGKRGDGWIGVDKWGESGWMGGEWMNDWEVDGWVESGWMGGEQRDKGGMDGWVGVDGRVRSRWIGVGGWMGGEWIKE